MNETSTSWSIKKLQQRTQYKINLMLKKRNQMNHVKTKVYSQEYIFKLLEKTRAQRTKGEIRIIADYLCTNFEYFTKLKDNDALKLEKLVGVLNLEIYHKNKNIINFGDEGDKFYVLIDGKVGVYKPFYKEREMSLNDYLTYLNNIKFQEQNSLKYFRILDKNSHYKLDLELLSQLDKHCYYMRSKLTFLVEDDELLGEFGPGFCFGEIALIRRSKRNATITSLNTSRLVSIDKTDYNRIIREVEEKRLSKVIDEFKRVYNLFEYWTPNSLIKLFNCFSVMHMIQGEYLYRQNEEAEYIYIIRSGVFEMYSLVSLGWVDNFYNYIVNPSKNLIYLMEGKKLSKENDYVNFFNTLRKDAIISPMKYDPLKVNAIITSKEEKDNIFSLKTKEEELFDEYNLFKIILKKIDMMDVVGIEDGLEMKKRFCFVKCVSMNAKVEKVNLYEFVKLINASSKENKKRIIEIIAQKKTWLYTQLKNAVKNKAISYERKFDDKYEKLKYEDKLNNHNDIKENNKKNARGNTLLINKLRSWNSELEELSGRDDNTSKRGREKNKFLSFSEGKNLKGKADDKKLKLTMNLSPGCDKKTNSLTMRNNMSQRKFSTCLSQFLPSTTYYSNSNSPSKFRSEQFNSGWFKEKNFPIINLLSGELLKNMSYCGTNKMSKTLHSTKFVPSMPKINKEENKEKEQRELRDAININFTSKKSFLFGLNFNKKYKQNIVSLK